MHTVTCPTCHNILRVPKPFVEAKVHCTGCGAVFVGSSVPLNVPEQAPPPPPPPAEATLRAPHARPAGRTSRRDHGRLYRGGKPPRQRVSASVAILAGVGIAGVIVLAIVCGYVMSRRSGPSTEGDTASRAGGKGGRRGGTDRTGQPGGVSQTQPSTGGQPAPPTGGGGTDTGGKGTPTPPTRPGTTLKGGSAGGSTLKHDEKIVVDLRQRHSSIGGVTTVYGEVRNNHDYPVKQIAIALVYINDSGKAIRVGACSDCMHVPAKGRVGFKTKIAKVPPGATLQAVAGAVPEPEGIVSWHVDTSEARYDTETADRTIIVRGKVSNPTRTAVADVELYCDFFDSDGILYRTVSGKLTKDFRIQPGKDAAYMVELTGLLSVSGIKPQPILRLVGRAER